VSLAVFGHVLDLDLSFHLSRKTGEVTKVVDRGTAAIQNVLSTILFSILPQVRCVVRGPAPRARVCTCVRCAWVTAGQASEAALASVGCAAGKHQQGSAGCGWGVRMPP
jgi:hypothetical protein